MKPARHSTAILFRLAAKRTTLHHLPTLLHSQPPLLRSQPTFLHSQHITLPRLATFLLVAPPPEDRLFHHKLPVLLQHPTFLHEERPPADGLPNHGRRETHGDKWLTRGRDLVGRHKLLNPSQEPQGGRYLLAGRDVVRRRRLRVRRRAVGSAVRCIGRGPWISYITCIWVELELFGR